MAMRVVCSGHLIRHPLGGHTWHHLQYLIGLQRLGCHVTFFEHYGWPNSCYDLRADVMTSDPSYGIEYLTGVLARLEVELDWCYLGEDDRTWGLTRDELAQRLSDCDVYFNLSNVNWIPEVMQCRRRVLVDTDPVFTQIGTHGCGGPFSDYHVLFTYGENIHRDGCTMPDGGAAWLPTRQPMLLDLWPITAGDAAAPFSTITNWSPLKETTYQGRVYGQKDREFEPYFSLPAATGEPMELAVAGAPVAVRERLDAGGWQVLNPMEITRDPWSYQRYLQASRAEFSVAKHAYASTECGWFSERTAAYMALGRPVVVQDTGFSRFLPTGTGLLAFKSPAEATAAVASVTGDYQRHCAAAREIVAEHFHAERVLTQMLEASI